MYSRCASVCVSVCLCAHTSPPPSIRALAFIIQSILLPGFLFFLSLYEPSQNARFFFVFVFFFLVGGRVWVCVCTHLKMKYNFLVFYLFLMGAEIKQREKSFAELQ